MMDVLNSATIPLEPQIINGQTVYAMGCPKCEASALGESNEVFDSLQSFHLTARREVVFHSKPPGDWFPLVNNQITVQPGRFLGSVIDYRITDYGLWLKVSAVSPGWFAYDPDAFDMKEKNSSATLSPEMKAQIMKDTISKVPGGDVVIKTGEVLKATADTLETTVSVGTRIIKYLPLIALAVGAGFVYLKYGDDIKKAFNQKAKKKPDLSGPKKKKKVKVIHL